MEISKEQGGEADVKALAEENKYLKDCIKKAAERSFFMRLDYLFRVVESGKFDDTDFYEECRDEIMSVLRLKEEGKKKMRDALGESR